MKINRALISVSDKSSIIEFARQLQQRQVSLLSTGGTFQLLNEHQVSAREVSDYTGFPEIMDGRVKTLHPKIHGGILARRGEDEPVMNEHDIDAIDLVVVNLYPFKNTVAQQDCRYDDAIENIDIGGPAMLRAAAKNHQHVAVVVDPADYPGIVEEITQSGGALSLATRKRLAMKAFQHTADYDTAVANYLRQQMERASPEGDESSALFNERLDLRLLKTLSLRYGENPHQAAALYQFSDDLPENTIVSAELLQGKALSYNNIADSDAAYQCVKSFSEPCCVIVKHANPCGVAVADTAHEAYNLAYRTDPTSAFGGIIAFNTAVDELTASAIIDRQFVEVIIAAKFSSSALTVLSRKPNVRVLRPMSAERAPAPTHTLNTLSFHSVEGGMLVQQADRAKIQETQLSAVSRQKASEAQIKDMLFAWKVAKHVKSNAIVYAKNQATIGIGAGQMSRVDSAKIAGLKAEDADLEVDGSVMASDAFFPFRDGIDAAAKAGVTAVIQPGGSMRDQEVIQAADEHGIAMVFTGMRHFRH